MAWREKSQTPRDQFQRIISSTQKFCILRGYICVYKRLCCRNCSNSANPRACVFGGERGSGIRSPSTMLVWSVSFFFMMCRNDDGNCILNMITYNGYGEFITNVIRIQIFCQKNHHDVIVDIKIFRCMNILLHNCSNKPPRGPHNRHTKRPSTKNTFLADHHVVLVVTVVGVAEQPIRTELELKELWRAEKGGRRGRDSPTLTPTLTN